MQSLTDMKSTLFQHSPILREVGLVTKYDSGSTIEE